MTEATTTVPDHLIGRWYWPTRRALAPLRRWLDLDVVDRANVPRHGGVILAANHLSFLDSPLLMHALARPVSTLGKVEYLEHWSTRTLFPRAGMIPVDRTGRGVGRSIQLATARLRSGEIVALFPEGTRSRDGRLHKGHPGVAHLALKSGCPIVPVGVTGTDKAMPAGRRIPRRSPITLRFGAPLDPGRWARAGSTGSVKRAITAEVMAAIASLTGQEQAPDHATSPDLQPAAA